MSRDMGRPSEEASCGTKAHGIPCNKRSQSARGGFPMTRWTSRLAWVSALALLAGPARAENERVWDIVAERSLAQARFEASRATVEELAKDREYAARMMHDIRR